MPGKDESPRPADLVVCTDVLEHIEPEKLPFVLDDLRRCVKQIGYFVIHTKAAAKTLADGRNAHLIQKDQAWWTETLGRYFTVGKVDVLIGPLIRVVVGVKPKDQATPSPTLRWTDLRWRTDPYPLGVAPQVLEPSLYQALVAKFPPHTLFKPFAPGGQNVKWSLSQVNHRDQYVAFLERVPLWKAFAKHIKDPSFVQSMRTLLRQQGIDVLDRVAKLSTRFEFSLLPADGGMLRPHTDLSSKLVTVVVSMRGVSDVWDWGGGTDILVPKPGTVALEDYRAEYDQFDVVDTVGYEVNQALLFVKTANSWHGVRTQGGPADQWRRTLTINIEKAV